MLPFEKYWSAVRNKWFLDAHEGDIGIGIAGVGGWGYTNAVSLMKTGRFRIVGVYDIDPKAADKFASRFKVKKYSSYAQLLSDKSIQAVVLTIPNNVHCTMAKQAIEHGKHVFVEKPLAPAKNECHLLHEMAAQKNITLMTGYQLRKEPAVEHMKSVVQNKTLGNALFAHGIRTLQRPHQGWRCDPVCCPGGSMEQLGSHFVDIMIHMFGYPESWNGWGKNIPFIKKAPDWGHIEMHFKDGVAGVVDSSFSSPARFNFNLYFEKGQFCYDGDTLVLINPDKSRKIYLKGRSGSEALFMEFADYVSGYSTTDLDPSCDALIAEIISSAGVNGETFDKI